MVAFVIWSVLSAAFLILGIFCFFGKKTMGFWANVKQFEVTDVKKYNGAVGKLWIFFAVGMEVLGIPLLDGQNSPLVMLSVAGMMILVILLMVIYVLVIDKKYRKK